VAERRTLINFQKLPPREKFLDREALETDIKDAIDKAERRLRDVAEKYRVTGWEPDMSVGSAGWDFDVLNNHIVKGTLTLRRE
jgi:hypothetical protein